ncbi:33365_t:CDS:1, partial [Racocetra persica]
MVNGQKIGTNEISGRFCCMTPQFHFTCINKSNVVPEVTLS